MRVNISITVTREVNCQTFSECSDRKRQEMYFMLLKESRKNFKPGRMIEFFVVLLLFFFFFLHCGIPIHVYPHPEQCTIYNCAQVLSLTSFLARVGK